MSKHYTKSENRNPYMKPGFWSNPSNQFWKNDTISYTPETIERYERMAAESEAEQRDKDSSKIGIPNPYA